MNPTFGLILLLTLSIPIILYVNITPVVQQFLASILPSGVENNAEFDFIVVGGGSAGSVVAARLAEEGHNVLLVEAGGPPNFLMGIPALVAGFQLTAYDWQYKTVPQKTLKHSISNWPRGKVLGGSSQLNYMIYVRGNPRDYDAWADLGNAGWSYKDVLPFFKKSQRYYSGPADPEYTGRYGPMHVQTFGDDDIAPLSKVIEDGLLELGHPQVDYNGKDQEGVHRSQYSNNHGWRASTYASFLAPLQGKGLRTLTFAHATKVLFKPGTNRIFGVQVSRLGKVMNLYAKNEVIVSGGSINSPQLLMLSGIGPKEHLKEIGIQVKVDLPGVGSNLQDHLISLSNLKVTSSEKRLGAGNFLTVNPWNYINFFLNGKGPLIDSGISVGAFLKTKVNQDPYKRPDIQFHTVPYGVDIDFGLVLKNVLNISDDVYSSLVQDDIGGDHATIYPTLLRPKSTGTIRLASKDPLAHPLIDPKYLSAKEDVDTLVAGYKILKSLVETKAFKKHGIEWSELPECKDKHGIHNDAYYQCLVRMCSFTVYHPAGTCKMGPKSDNMAVVDPTLKVHGVTGLRVIDASIMPKIVSGNTNSPSIMIGERGVDFIINQWKSSKTKNTKAPKDEL